MTEETTEPLTPHSLLINWCDGDDEQGNFSWAGLALDSGDAEIQARTEMCNSLYGDDLKELPDDVLEVGGSIVEHYEGANLWAAKQGLDALRAAVAWVEKTGIADSDPPEYLDMKAAIERLEGRS